MTHETISVGILAKHNVGWTAGKLYLNSIAETIRRLPTAVRPSLHLMMSEAEHAAHRSDLQIGFDSDFRYNGLGVGLKGLIKKSMQNWSGRAQTVGNLGPEVVRHGIDCVLPCQISLGTNFPVPWIGWIPDFQHKHYPNFFSPREFAKRDHQFQKLIDESTLVMVSSQDARDDLLRWYNACESKVRVYSFCTFPKEDWFAPDPRQVADTHGLPQKYLLYPSQFWIHKNHLKLFQAIDRLTDKHPDIALVLTGHASDYRHPEYAQELKALFDSDRLRDHIFWLGLLPRFDQIQILRCAAAIVQPSLFEGWSMLVEDCRSLGKPICLSNIPVHQEQSPPQSTFFDPNDLSEMTDAVGQVWQQTSPGPSVDTEQAARCESERRARGLADDLLGIISQAAAGT